jgi:hypothetical protein
MLTKIEAIDFINRLKENDSIKLYSDNYWPYPFDLPLQLRDAKNSIMLDVMIGIEKRPGILLYIPNNTIDEIMKEKVNSAITLKQEDLPSSIAEIKEPKKEIVKVKKQIKKKRGK